MFVCAYLKVLDIENNTFKLDIFDRRISIFELQLRIVFRLRSVILLFRRLFRCGCRILRRYRHGYFTDLGCVEDCHFTECVQVLETDLIQQFLELRQHIAAHSAVRLIRKHKDQLFVSFFKADDSVAVNSQSVIGCRKRVKVLLQLRCTDTAVFRINIKQCLHLKQRIQFIQKVFIIRIRKKISCMHTDLRMSVRFVEFYGTDLCIIHCIRQCTVFQNFFQQ